jgi:hypothetical protein
MGRRLQMTLGSGFGIRKFSSALIFCAIEFQVTVVFEEESLRLVSEGLVLLESASGIFRLMPLDESDD